MDRLAPAPSAHGVNQHVDAAETGQRVGDQFVQRAGFGKVYAAGQKVLR
jgi:hypothetical protein